MKKELELYIHIPFCVQKCAYCDFLSAPASQEKQELYIKWLLKEIKTNRGLAERYEVVSVFFGGGTPSILEAKHIAEILEKVYRIFSIKEGAEISIEINPGTIDREKLECYRAAGINRISFGLQSANDSELKNLGRIHIWEDFLEGYQLARELGFKNINVDVMSALPNQTRKSYHDSLQKVLALHPEHISAYSLIIEEGTSFFERYSDHLELLPSEDEERMMYYDTKELLQKEGYHRYEISNYAREGYECRHNLGYWERKDYKGFGLGAASLLENVRSTNTSDFANYVKGNFCEEKETLSEREIREEYFFLGLRKMEGVLVGNYRDYYGELIEKLKRQDLLEEQGDRIYLTEKGIDVSNYVLAQFLE